MTEHPTNKSETLVFKASESNTGEALNKYIVPIRPPYSHLKAAVVCQGDAKIFDVEILE